VAIQKTSTKTTLGSVNINLKENCAKKGTKKIKKDKCKDDGKKIRKIDMCFLDIAVLQLKKLSTVPQQR
jgi:hypothetical protein